MKRSDLTEKLLDIKREKGWSWKFICEKIGGYSEVVMVNGPAWKALIEEEYGDGIMSAIDFDMVMERLPNPKGDRVKITMSGKFLPYKYYGASGNVPEYGFKEG